MLDEKEKRGLFLALTSLLCVGGLFMASPVAQQRIWIKDLCSPICSDLGAEEAAWLLTFPHYRARQQPSLSFLPLTEES